MASFTPLLILMGLTLAFAVLVTIITFILGPKKPTAAKLSPYECGIEEIDPPKQRFPIKYLVTGMLFIVFDIEAASMLPFADLMRRLGSLGFYELVIFVAVLMLALVYVWRKGAFSWE